MVQLPALCKRCGASFPSAFAFENSTNITVSGLTQTCPFCGFDADIFDGTFNVTGNAIELLKSGEISDAMLSQFGRIAKQARKENTSVDTFADQAETIHPKLGEFVKQSKGKISFATLLIIIIFLSVKSCSIDISLDANKVIDQLLNQPPASLIEKIEEEENSDTDIEQDNS